MCRNIRSLFNYEPKSTKEEIESASLQYIRKISGFAKPSQANDKAFNEAVKEISKASKKLLNSLSTDAKPKNREVEAEKARKRFLSRG